MSQAETGLVMEVESRQSGAVGVDTYESSLEFAGYNTLTKQWTKDITRVAMVELGLDGLVLSSYNRISEPRDQLLRTRRLAQTLLGRLDHSH